MVFENKKSTGPTIRGAGGVRYEMTPRGTFQISGEGEDEKRAQFANFTAESSPT